MSASPAEEKTSGTELVPDNPDQEKSGRGSEVTGVANVLELLAALRPLRDVPMLLTVELGRGRLKLGDLLGLKFHSIFELDKNAGAKLDLYVNGVPLGKGDPVVVEDRLGIKINDIADFDR